MFACSIAIACARNGSDADLPNISCLLRTCFVCLFVCPQPVCMPAGSASWLEQTRNAFVLNQRHLTVWATIPLMCTRRGAQLQRLSPLSRFRFLTRPAALCAAAVWKIRCSSARVASENFATLFCECVLQSRLSHMLTVCAPCRRDASTHEFEARVTRSGAYTQNLCWSVCIPA